MCRRTCTCFLSVGSEHVTILCVCRLQMDTSIVIILEKLELLCNFADTWFLGETTDNMRLYNNTSHPYQGAVR